MHLIKYIQKYKTPTCFGTELPSSGSHSEQRSIRPARLTRYYVAFGKIIEILKF
jgi:hypothetical protein